MPFHLRRIAKPPLTSPKFDFLLMDWKIIIGILLIFGAVNEMYSIISDYQSGKISFWPFGADFGCIAVVIGSIYLLRKGLKERSNKMSK